MRLQIKKKLKVIFLLLLAGLLASSCSALQPKPAALSDEQVGEVVENLLLALDQGDYAAFSRDFSAEMKAAFTQAEFDKIRQMLQEASGSYISKSTAKLSNSEDYAIYRLDCVYKQENVIVTVSFKVAGDKVEGLFFDSPNLRAANQS
ncbi:MAG: DUF3887 domain-containing protein [Anaerolineales bacterium]|nr:DUF3887 domain-containing protein [Anaerolineales bacterium]